MDLNERIKHLEQQLDEVEAKRHALREFMQDRTKMTCVRGLQIKS